MTEICTLCGKEFETALLLYDHLRDVHNDG